MSYTVASCTIDFFLFLLLTLGIALPRSRLKGGKFASAVETVEVLIACLIMLMFWATLAFAPALGLSERLAGTYAALGIIAGGVVCIIFYVSLSLPTTTTHGQPNQSQGD